MGCDKKGKGGGKRKLAVMVGAVALVAGCSAKDLSQLESPYVVAGVATASKEGCYRAAKEDAEKAAVGLRVLNGMLPQLQACQEGLIQGLADPNAL